MDYLGRDRYLFLSQFSLTTNTLICYILLRTGKKLSWYNAVCHRYKGVKVEVHHIIPVAKGRTDEAENAIALCFDCHTDAGHYNSKHPRGTKFSPEELNHARDMWHFAVKANKITPPDKVDYIYARYLVCKSYSAIREICGGILNNFPVDSPFLFQNVIVKFQTYVVESHPDNYRHSHIGGEAFRTHEEFTKKHPDVRILDRTSKNLFPYFEAQRLPTHQELRQNVANKDSVTSLLLDAGVPPENISSVFAYDEACGDRRFQEIYRLRPLWTVYLAISNISNHPVSFKSLLCEYEQSSGVSFRPFIEKICSTNKEINLPHSPIPPNATVVIPISTLLGPIDGESPALYWQDMSDISTGEVQVSGHGDGSNVINNTAIIGPSLWPKAIRVEDSSHHEVEHQIHDFDLSNLYTIDRSWECGSCPHLFFETLQGKKYWGELFAKAPKEVQTTHFQIPTGVSGCIIAELEQEVSRIVKISVNNTLIYSGVTLNRNEHLSFPVKTGDYVCLIGFYEPLPSTKELNPNPWLKNEIVLDYMRTST
ncbi:MAG: HNH endonuclease [Nitrospirae bacterium]|nr:HNH endonuclease [Nitrospirota bacterium]